MVSRGKGVERRMAWLMTLGTPPSKPPDPHQRACRAPASPEETLWRASPCRERGGKAHRGPGRILRGEGVSWRRSLCVVDSPPTPAIHLPSDLSVRTWGRILFRKSSVKGMGVGILEMRVVLQKAVVLAPTTCPQMGQKERDTDPEEEQCDQELRLRNAATGPETGRAGGTLPWSLQRTQPCSPGFHYVGSRTARR